jgi:RNA polymerase sigma factor (sigma-70 family)
VSDRSSTAEVAESPLPEDLEEEAGTASPEEPAAEPPQADEIGLPEATRATPGEDRNFLAMYFREMATLSVLRPEEEFLSARRIEELEIALWETVFGYTPLLDLVLHVVERALHIESRDFRTLRECARRLRERPGTEARTRYRRQSAATAARLREADIDRIAQVAVIKEIWRVARRQKTRAGMARVAVNPQSAAFRQYLLDVRDTYLRVRRAKNDFVKANLRLVVSIARRFNHGRMPLADLIQEGNIGLIKAVERFDYKRGYRFSTYASWWIRHAISRALADKGRAVRLPVHMIDAYHRVAKSSRELLAKLGRQPTAAELEETTGIAAAKIEKMRTFLTDQSFSLDRAVSEEDGRKFIDFLTEPEGTPTITDRLALQAMSDEVRELLDHLKPIEADILRQRFGLDSDRELTLKEIGDKYHLSRERIRQLQEQALGKMRRALARKEML